MNNIEMYNEFRREITEYATPLCLSQLKVYPIKYNRKKVGMLCVTKDGYIDCLYIKPEFRRKGLGKLAVLNYLKSDGDKLDVRLHIIQNNFPALMFWNSFLELEEIHYNGVDTLYRVKGIR